jgi:hypothetical protein
MIWMMGRTENTGRADMKCRLPRYLAEKPPLPVRLRADQGAQGGYPSPLPAEDRCSQLTEYNVWPGVLPVLRIPVQHLGTPQPPTVSPSGT